MDDLVCYLINLLFFDILLLDHYINLRSIVFCLFSEDISLSLGIFLSYSIVTVSELFLGEILEAFLILLAILLPLKPPVACAVFWISIFVAD